MTDSEHQDEHYQSRLDLALWRRIARHARPYRRALLGLAVSGLLMAAADSFLPLVTAWIIDDATSGESPSHLLRHGLIYFALVTSIALLIWFFIVWAIEVTRPFWISTRGMIRTSVNAA